MIIMFLNCNGLPQKRLYFKRRVSHNIKQNLSILRRGHFLFKKIKMNKKFYRVFSNDLVGAEPT